MALRDAPPPRWARLIIIGYLALALATGIALFGVVQQQQTSCIDRRNARQAVRDLVIIATDAPAPDYSRFPSFSELDPAMQDFLKEVSAAAQTGTLSDFRARALEKLPPEQC